MDLTRTELERVVRPVIERCHEPVVQALRDAGAKPGDIQRIVFVGGPTRMPVVRAFFEEIFGRKSEMGVDPMECVASGAAIQAGVLAGEVGGIVLVDVTPLTLGVEALGGIATPLIARNTPIPVRKSEIFTTAADLQTSVTIHVFQGERPMPTDNVSLGEFNLDGLAPAPRGMPKIEVTFDIDANGILSASARGAESGLPGRTLAIDGLALRPGFERQSLGQRLVHADHERAPGMQPGDQPLQHKPLQGLREIGQHGIAAQDQIERPVGHLLPDVLLRELDHAEFVFQAELCRPGDECFHAKFGRKRLQAARPIAAEPGAFHQAPVDISCHDVQPQPRKAGGQTELPYHGEGIGLLPGSAAGAPA